MDIRRRKQFINDSNKHRKDEIDGFVDEQFVDDEKIIKKPWRTIFLSTTLFIIGLICSIYSLLGWLNLINEHDIDRLTAYSIIGGLLLPLGYYVWLTIGAFLNWKGYSFERLPQFD